MSRKTALQRCIELSSNGCYFLTRLSNYYIFLVLILKTLKGRVISEFFEREPGQVKAGDYERDEDGLGVSCLKSIRARRLICVKDGFKTLRWIPRGIHKIEW